MKKLVYSAPLLRKHGSVEAITQQNATGANIDMTFNAGTPVTELTLS